MTLPGYKSPFSAPGMGGGQLHPITHILGQGLGGSLGAGGNVGGGHQTHGGVNMQPAH